MYFKIIFFFTIVSCALAVEWFEDTSIGYNPNLPMDRNRMGLKKDMRNDNVYRVTDIIILDYPLSINMKERAKI